MALSFDAAIIELCKSNTSPFTVLKTRWVISADKFEEANFRSASMHNLVHSYIIMEFYL